MVIGAVIVYLLYVIEKLECVLNPPPTTNRIRDLRGAASEGKNHYQTHVSPPERRGRVNKGVRGDAD